MQTKTLRTAVIAIALASAIPEVGYTQTAAKPNMSQDHQKMMHGMPDGQFVPMMIKHHEEGIAMARMEEQRGSAASVKALAKSIRESQERDLPELKAHAAHATGTDAKTSTAQHAPMMDEMSKATMTRLKAASGAALDRAFVEEMITHHQIAISVMEGAKLQNAELKKLSEKMLAGQRRELAELKKL